MTDRTDDEISALVEAATPGPWILSEPQGNWISPHICNTYGSLRADAEFIAAARSLVPSLLARAQKAEAEASIYRDERDAEARANKTLGAERDALAARLQAVREIVERRSLPWEGELPATVLAALLADLRGALGDVAVLDVPLDTPEGETAARGENVYFDPSLASDSTILEAARPYCKHGVLPADACALCSPVGSPEGETAKANVRPDVYPDRDARKPLRHSPVGSSGGEQ